MSFDKIIIADTETTGLSNEDRVIQLALPVLNAQTYEVEESYCDLCNPKIPIKPGASKINKKTDDMLEDKPDIHETEAYKALLKYNKPNNVLVFHNAFFDLYMLAKELFLIEMELVDTLTCSRYIYPTMERHKLETLVNMVNRNSVSQEHDALSDCSMCKDLLSHMLSNNNINKLIQYTKSPIIGFGKHKGSVLSELAKEKPDYLDWLLKNYDNMDAPTRLVIKTIMYPSTLDNTELKGLRYLSMHHFL